MTQDILFELGCEELPSASVKPLAQALAENVVNALDKAGITHGFTRSYATPRRLSFIIEEVVGKQPTQKIIKRGPAFNAGYDVNGNPSQALLGFAKSCGVEIEALTTIDTEKGQWFIFEEEKEGDILENILPDMLKNALNQLPIPKPMRWGRGNFEFSRPVHWAILLYGSQIIKTELLGVNTGNQSHGHRFHHPQALTIELSKTYEDQLYKSRVIADFAKRQEQIVNQIKSLATSLNAEAIMPQDLLDEVTSIVEWPVSLVVNFDKHFLDVPAEALIASMQSHQKCFALKNTKNELLPQFITVSNIESTHPEQVIQGNEKVMRARLSDAAFFYEMDKKQPLSSKMKATEKVVFQHKLGSLWDKSVRMAQMMLYLTHVLDIDPEIAYRLATVSKCDLLTGMVNEFPELQGLMGYYYALNDGETKTFANALNEQYLPRFSGDILPKSDLGLSLSLVDRLDTLVGIFGIGQKPSGVKDPFKLRRHALALVRLLISTPAPILLTPLINQGILHYGDLFQGNTEILPELKSFLLERLTAYYQSQDISNDLVLAVRARQDEYLHDFDNRIKALAMFVKKPASVSLSAACKRVNNILNQNKTEEFGAIDEALLENPAEKTLYQLLVTLEQTTGLLYEISSYDAILDQLASLKEPVDAFFDQVMVMVDNPALKKNRLHLLKRLQDFLQGVADISLLQN